MTEPFGTDALGKSLLWPPLLGAAAAASGSDSDTSARSGSLSGSSPPSSCGGGAGCSGCEPRLAIRVVVATGGGGEGEAAADEDDFPSDVKSPRAGGSGGGGTRRQQQRRRQGVHGRAVLHAGGGFSFREDREGGKPIPSATSNPFARCFSWLCGGGGGGERERRISGSSYDVEASDLVGALQVFPPPPLSSTAATAGSSRSLSSSSSSPAFAPFSASRGRLPPLRPVPSSQPSSPRSRSFSPFPPFPPPPTTAEEVVARIRATAAPWDNQLPSDPPRPRRALVVINPSAGSGRGVALFEGLLAPMLEAAGVAVEAVVLTKKRGDAARAARAADPSLVGALVAIGGDGTAAELLQGLMTRRQDSAEAARRMPLAVLPAGSGNALALSSSGGGRRSSSSRASTSSNASPPAPHPAASVCATRAAATISKGRSAPLDVVVADSSWEGGGREKREEEEEEERRGKRGLSPSMRFAADGALLLPPPSSSSSPAPPIVARRFAFLSLTYGLIANADVGTDPWRWMGPLRFTLGALREVAARRAHGLDAFVVDAAAAAGPSVPPPSPAPPAARCCRFPGALPTPLLDSLPASALLSGGSGAAPREETAETTKTTTTREGRGSSSSSPPPPPPPWRRLAADDAALFACCNLPRLDASTHLAPGARRDCGELHLVRTRGGVPRLAALRLLSQVESGSHVPPSSESESKSGSEKLVVVDRVRALLLRPLDASRHGRLALDGEELPPGRPVALEVVPAGARLLVAEF